MSVRRSTTGAALLVMSVVVLLLISVLGSDVGARRKSVRATLRDAAGNTVGHVRIRPHKGATDVSVRARQLAPGFHGFHVHAIGVCDPDAPGGPFTSAGGHYNPTGQGHGDHAGDMPTLLVMDDGTGRASFTTDRFTAEELLDADGSAIIVHAGRDNYANIPTRYHSHTENTFGPDSATLATGDAGSRAACGVVGDGKVDDDV
jgi:superoxide dismutase, Cu-Zn family